MLKLYLILILITEVILAKIIFIVDIVTTIKMTSIADLQNSEQQQQMEYMRRMQQMQPTQQMQPMQQMQQMQPMSQMVQQPMAQMTGHLMGQGMGQPMGGHPIPEYRPDTQQAPTMEELAREIDTQLSKPKRRRIDDDDDTIDMGTPEPTKEKGGLLSFIPCLLREPLLIVILYTVLSHPKVREFFGQYVKQINEGSLTGVFIYGCILALLFSVVKKVLIKW